MSEPIDYGVEFFKKYEQMLHEHIRKAVDLEIRLSVANQEIEKYKEAFETSQKEVEKQNEYIKQAATSIEALTLDKKSLEGRVAELDQLYTSTREEKDRLDHEMRGTINQLTADNELKDAKITEYERELARQKDELQMMFEEKKSIQKELNSIQGYNPPAPKTNKSKKKNIADFAVTNSDNTF